MRNVKKLWNKARVEKLVRMKTVGHRSYREISKILGCKIKDAREKYLSIA